MDNSAKMLAGMAASPVNAGEVRRLILQAQAAWRAQTACGLTEDPFDGWRKAALWDAVSKGSFRALTQREYGLALAHFIRLAGGEVRGRAGLNAAIARREGGAEGDRRRAEHKLREACAGLADAFGSEAQALAYALALLRQIHKAELQSATPRQIVQTLFTLRARAAKRRRANKETP